MSLAATLGPKGAVAKNLGNYEFRPQQLEMAEAVASAIATKRHLLVEAGTGVGKSFAYLVPAVLAAVANPKSPVVVSTHTISLQEQLVQKDIPFLQKVMPQPFSAVLVKGRSNYISLRACAGHGRKWGLCWPTPARNSSWRQSITGHCATADGSRSSLHFQPAPIVWDLVESDSGNCLGRKCQILPIAFTSRQDGKFMGPTFLSSITRSSLVTWRCVARARVCFPNTPWPSSTRRIRSRTWQPSISV